MTTPTQQPATAVTAETAAPKKNAADKNIICGHAIGTQLRVALEGQTVDHLYVVQDPANAAKKAADMVCMMTAANQVIKSPKTGLAYVFPAFMPVWVSPLDAALCASKGAVPFKRMLAAE